MRNRRMYLLALLVAAAGLVLGACGDDDDTDDASDDTSEATEPDAGTDTDTDETDGDSVAIVDFAFSPEDLTVAPGTEIEVSNQDSAPHTYTSADGGFDTGSLSADGGDGSVTAPSEAGTYEVICTIHPAITGTLTVES